MAEFKCTLLTPDGMFFDGNATMVIAPGLLGQFGVLAGHEHIVAILKKGILVIKAERQQNFFAIEAGSLEVDGGHAVIILADKAIKAEDEQDALRRMLDLTATRI